MIQNTFTAKQQNREVPAFGFLDDDEVGYGLDKDDNPKHFGDLIIDGDLTVTGTASIDGATSVANPVGGVAADYKIARGVVTLDGGNPTVITTGLATVVSITVTDKRTDSPGLDPVFFTVNFGGGVTAGTVDLYAWKFTGTGDCTLIASTDSNDVIAWIAVGT